MSDDITVVEFETFVWYFTHRGPINDELSARFLALPIKLRKEIWAYPWVYDLNE